MNNYRGLEMILGLESPGSLLVFAEENFKIHNEHGGNGGELIFDCTLPVNGITPQYSVCMGLAFDVWLHNHL